MSAADKSRWGESEIAERMARLGVKEADIEEHFLRSGGPGGQNVNKTSTCVLLVHRPTGVTVKCQTTRHQGANRTIARRLLLDRIETERRNRAAEARRLREKSRRQHRRPSPAAKNRMLADKLQRSRVKQSRRRVDAARAED